MRDELVYVKAMLARTMGNKALAITLFEKLSLELPQQILSIEQAIVQEQIYLAQKKLHQLQGSLSFCGFNRFVKIAQDLENTLEVDNSEERKNKLSRLSMEIEQFINLQEAIGKVLEDYIR